MSEEVKTAVSAMIARLTERESLSEHECSLFLTLLDRAGPSPARDDLQDLRREIQRLKLSVGLSQVT